MISDLVTVAGIEYILIIYAFAFIFGFLYRAILKKFAHKKVRTLSHNIARPDRLLRVALGVALLIWAVTTDWSDYLIFFSGFCFFEAFFSWCGLYAAIGKSSCPIE